MAIIPVSAARAALPELLDRVQAGEELTITRHGRPVAVLIRPDALRSRRAEDAFLAAEQVRNLLAAGRKSALPATGGLSKPGGLSERRAEQLIAEVRAGRAAR